VNRARVSIVTPLYNAAAWIEETIASVRAQTLEDWAYAVIDDGSTDGSFEVALKAAAGDTRISVVRGEPKRHPGPHRNAGARLATSDFLWFVDADDVAMPTFLERAIGVLDRTNAGVVHTGARHLHGSRLEDPNPHYSGPTLVAPPGMVGHLARGARLYVPCTLFRRSVFDAAGGFSEDPILRLGDDTNLWWRLALTTSFAYIPERLFLIRFHEKSLSAPSQRNADAYRGRIFTIEESIATAPDLGSATNRARAEHLANRLCRLAETLLESDDTYGEAPSIYARVRRMRQPLSRRSLLYAPFAALGSSLLRMAAPLLGVLRDLVARVWGSKCVRSSSFRAR
jgi:glycosyltransferase involved in cell wall biosynthesis